jgi:hypothetical protein
MNAIMGRTRSIFWAQASAAAAPTPRPAMHESSHGPHQISSAWHLLMLVAPASAPVRAGPFAGVAARQQRPQHRRGRSSTLPAAAAPAHPISRPPPPLFCSSSTRPTPPAVPPLPACLQVRMMIPVMIASAFLNNTPICESRWAAPLLPGGRSQCLVGAHAAAQPHARHQPPPAQRGFYSGLACDTHPAVLQARS